LQHSDESSATCGYLIGSRFEPRAPAAEAGVLQLVPSGWSCFPIVGLNKIKQGEN